VPAPSELSERCDALLERLERAVPRSGRSPGSVILVAVSKTYGADAVAELARHLRARSGRPAIFGENYMQEAVAKISLVAELLARDGPAAFPETPPAGRALSPDAPDAAPVCPRWHFIGGLQTRKAKDAAGRFALIHSLDSVKLAVALHEAREKTMRDLPCASLRSQSETAPQDVLVQVNVGREAQKSGVDPEGLEDLLNAVAPLSGLRVRGLMCVPPAVPESGTSRPWFIMLRRLRDEMEQRCGLSLPQLSMGMSDDFEEAVEEGATLVRIGSLLFGPRRRHALSP
jgi:pyridoxal phosphate enzyme (YggS family)